jgi:hypothetical protein
MQPVFEIEINRYIEHWQSPSCFEKTRVTGFPTLPATKGAQGWGIPVG